MRGCLSHLRVPALALLAIALVAGGANSQFCLLTNLVANNGQSGNMFDVVATNPVTVTSFEVNLDPGTWDMEIYARTGGGTFQGVQQMPAMWTLVGTQLGVVGATINQLVALNPNLVNVPIAAGATQGFYVTASNGTGINYTNGANFGGITAFDGNIQVTEGNGNVYPFGGAFGGPTVGVSGSRIFSGRVCYSAPLIPGNGQVPQIGKAVLNVNQAFEANGLPVGATDLMGNILPGPFAATIQSNSSMNLSFSGQPNQPIILIQGPLNPQVATFGAIGQLDVGGPLMGGIPTGIQIVANGFNLSLPDGFFILGANGTLNFELTVPPLMSGTLTTLQAIIASTPTVISISNAVTVSVM